MAWLFAACCFLQADWVVRAAPSTVPREDFWVPNGPVFSVLVTNDMVYLGGRFDYIGPTAGTGGTFDIFSGEPTPEFPKTDGAVAVALPDGRGGWFIGGRFTSIGGVPVANLAHVRPNRTVNANWTPNPNGAVEAMVSRGDVRQNGFAWNGRLGDYFGRLKL